MLKIVYRYNSIHEKVEQVKGANDIQIVIRWHDFEAIQYPLF